MSLLWRKPIPICQVHKHYHCIGHLPNSYLLKDGYTRNGPGSRGQRTHISMWTLRAPLVSIYSKILNLSLKALKERFSATKKKNVLFLCILIRERYQIFTQEVNVCKCSQTAWIYEKWDWVMKAADSKVYSRNMSSTLASTAFLSSFSYKPEDSTVSRLTHCLLQSLD